MTIVLTQEVTTVMIRKNAKKILSQRVSSKYLRMTNKLYDNL